MRVFLNKEGRRIIQEGINLAVDCIKSTLGASGKTAIIYSGGQVGITKDGLLISRSLVLEGDLNIGAQIIRNATEIQLRAVGDGTTLVSVVTQKIIEYGFDCIERGIDLFDLKSGIDKSVEVIKNELSKQAEQINGDNEKIKNIATISANNDISIGELISEAFGKIGHDGELFIEESKTNLTSVTVQEGFRIDNGWMSPLFANRETMESELIQPYILLFEGKIDRWNQISGLLSEMMDAKRTKDILIICDNIEGEALQTLVTNRLKGQLNVTCVRAPYFGERRKYAMEDISALTGATYISTDRGIGTMKLSHTGVCDKCVITGNDTTILNGHGDKEEVEKISNQIDALLTQSKSDYETTMLKQRKSMVLGRLATISVGAPSESEMKEKKDRVEDAVLSCKSAILSGTLPGGGVSLLMCIEKLKILETKNESQKLGVEVMIKAIEAPIRQILENAGIDNKDEIISEILSKGTNFGFNIKSRKVENLREAGVIDAANVITNAVENAASVAGTVLTAESLIC